MPLSCPNGHLQELTKGTDVDHDRHKVLLFPLKVLLYLSFHLPSTEEMNATTCWKLCHTYLNCWIINVSHIVTLWRLGFGVYLRFDGRLREIHHTGLRFLEPAGEGTLHEGRGQFQHILRKREHFSLEPNDYLNPVTRHVPRRLLNQ